MMKGWTNIFRIAVSLAVGALSVGCGEGDPSTFRYFDGGPADGNGSNPSNLSTITTMAIRPAYSQLTAGTRVQLSTNVWLEDGSLIQDARDSVDWSDGGNESAHQELQWTTDNYGIATVDGSGMVTAHSSGETIIRVRCGDHEATARVVVSSTNSHDPNIDTGAPAPTP